MNEFSLFSFIPAKVKTFYNERVARASRADNSPSRKNKKIVFSSVDTTKATIIAEGFDGRKAFWTEGGATLLLPARLGDT
jgi:hypothetical protein